MAKPTYLATIARRASGAAAVLAPPPVPMRGWQGAWHGEPPTATVIRPGPAHPIGAAPRLPIDDAARVLRDPGDGERAAPNEVAPVPASRRELAPAPAIGQVEGVASSRDDLAASAHDERGPARRAEPGDDSPAILRAPQRRVPPRPDERAAEPVPGRRPAGPRPSPGASPGQPQDPARDVSSPAPASVSPRLSPSAALQAAFRWVSAAPAARPEAAPGTEPREREPRSPVPRRDPSRPSAPPAPAAVSPVPDGKPAARAIHIGSIQVAMQAPPDSGPPAPSRPGAAIASTPLSRGFATPLGLRQS